MKKIRLGWRVLFHTLGLACLCSSVFIQILVFGDMILQGYFLAVEKNQLVLCFEVFLASFAFIYFVYVYQRFIRSVG